MNAFAFCIFEQFCYFGFWREITLKKNFTEEESEEADEFHGSQKCLGQSSSKKFSKKNFHGFCMFSNLSARFLTFFFRLFFYCFLSAVIKEEIGWLVRILY